MSNPLHASPAVDRGSRAGGLLLALLVFAVGLGLTVWQAPGADAWLGVLFAGSAVSAYVVWRTIRWPDAWSRFLSFGGVLLLACVVNRVLYLADIALSDHFALAWPFYTPDPVVATIKAEIATVLGTFVVVASWLLGGGARFSPVMVLQQSRRSLLLLLGTAYAGSLLALLLTTLMPQVARLSGQLLPTLLGIGAATAFFLPLLLSRRRSLRLLLVVLMALPFLYASLGTGSKETILLALAPSAFLFWMYSRGTGARLALVLAAVLVVAVITSYISYFRTEVWYADRAVAQEQVMQEYFDAVVANGITSTVGDGVQAFLVRNDAGAYRGWAVSLADQYGYAPGLVFAPLSYAFVPRILWPGKPEIQQGLEFSGMVFGQHYIASIDSSLSAGLFSALYLGQGWPAVVLGALLIGMTMALLTRLAARVGGPVLAGLYGLSLLPYALRLDENWTVGAFTAPIITFVYVVIVYQLARVAAALLGRPDAALVRAS